MLHRTMRRCIGLALIAALRMIQLRLFTIAWVDVSILVNVIIRAAWVVVKWEIDQDMAGATSLCMSGARAAGSENNPFMGRCGMPKGTVIAHINVGARLPRPRCGR